MRSTRGYGVSLTHRLSPPLGHRRPTRGLKALRSWAIFSSWFQILPIHLMSFCRFFDRPFYPPPSGFQDRACLVMLLTGFFRVWLVHLHLLWRISGTGSLGPQNRLCRSENTFFFTLVNCSFLKFPFMVKTFLYLHSSFFYQNTETNNCRNQGKKGMEGERWRMRKRETFYA